MTAVPGIEAFRAALRSPDELWRWWLENDDVVDPNQAGVIVATGRPEPEAILVAKQAADTAGWSGMLDDYWAFLGSTGSRSSRAARALPASPPRNPTSCGSRPDASLCFGELCGSGYLFFRRTRTGFFRREITEVWFYDFKEPTAPATKLASSFDDFLAKLAEHRLRLPSLLTASGAAGW